MRRPVRSHLPRTGRLFAENMQAETAPPSNGRSLLRALLLHQASARVPGLADPVSYTHLDVYKRQFPTYAEMLFSVQ